MCSYLYMYSVVQWITISVVQAQFHDGKSPCSRVRVNRAERPDPPRRVHLPVVLLLQALETVLQRLPGRVHDTQEVVALDRLDHGVKKDDLA